MSEKFTKEKFDRLVNKVANEPYKYPDYSEGEYKNLQEKLKDGNLISYKEVMDIFGKSYTFRR